MNDRYAYSKWPYLDRVRFQESIVDPSLLLENVACTIVQADSPTRRMLMDLLLSLVPFLVGEDTKFRNIERPSTNGCAFLASFALLSLSPSLSLSIFSDVFLIIV